MTQLSPLQRKINFYNYYFAKMASDIFEFRVHVRNIVRAKCSAKMATNKPQIKKCSCQIHILKYGNTYCCCFIVHFNKKFHICLSLVDNQNFQHKTIQYFRIVLIDF